MAHPDSFAARSTLSVGEREYEIFRLDALQALHDDVLARFQPRGNDPHFAALGAQLDRASLGASDWIVFWRVFFPLTLPSLAAGAILVFILTLGFFITPAILGGGRVPMIANMLDLLINRLPRWELAAAISTMLLIMTLVCYAAYRWVGARAQS